MHLIGFNKALKGRSQKTEKFEDFPTCSTIALSSLYCFNAQLFLWLHMTLQDCLCLFMLWYLCVCVYLRVYVCICVCNVGIAISALASCHLPLVSGKAKAGALFLQRLRIHPGYTHFRVAYFGGDGGVCFKLDPNFFLAILYFLGEANTFNSFYVFIQCIN